MKRSPVSSLLVAACTLLHAAAHAQGVREARDARATLSRAAATYKAAETIRARFDQTLTNSLTGTTSKARGELFRHRPDLFAVVFTDPPSDRIVADGRTLWVYLPSSAPKQVIRTAVNASDALPDPIGQVLAAPPEQYDVTDAGMDTVNGHATRAVTVTPKHQTGSAFTRATVWIDEASGVVHQVEVTEPSGLTRRLVITRFAANVPIPRSTFTFTPPPGTRVVEGSGVAR